MSIRDAVNKLQSWKKDADSAALPSGIIFLSAMRTGREVIYAERIIYGVHRDDQ